MYIRPIIGLKMSNYLRCCTSYILERSSGEPHSHLPLHRYPSPPFSCSSPPHQSCCPRRLSVCTHCNLAELWIDFLWAHCLFRTKDVTWNNYSRKSGYIWRGVSKSSLFSPMKSWKLLRSGIEPTTMGAWTTKSRWRPAGFTSSWKYLLHVTDSYVDLVLHQSSPPQRCWWKWWSNVREAKLA